MVINGLAKVEQVVYRTNHQNRHIDVNKDGVNRPITDSKDYLSRYYILFTIFILQQNS